MIEAWSVREPAGYRAVEAIQAGLVEQVASGRRAGALLFVEHPEVITVGRRPRAEAHVLDPNIPVERAARGGDVTWHGPGQLVAYPIVPTRDAAAHLRALEQAVIEVLTPLGLSPARDPRGTGVWLRPPQGLPLKVCSIGVAVRRWVSWHGLALNLSVDLQRFRTIRPCGLEPEVMTSLQHWCAPAPTRSDLEGPLATALARVLAVELAAPEPRTLEQLVIAAELASCEESAKQWLHELAST